MNKDDVMKLLAAGFTAEEIRGMLNPEAASKEAPETAPEEVKKEAPEVAPEKSVEAAPKKEAAPAVDIAGEVEKALQPFKDLYKQMAKIAGMPSMADVQPLGIDDVVRNFFKEE